MFYYRDLLSKNLKKQELYSLLEHNKQEVPTGEDRALDRLSDVMTFGALEPCGECGGGQLVYQSGLGYRCQGDISGQCLTRLISTLLTKFFRVDQVSGGLPEPGQEGVQGTGGLQTGVQLPGDVQEQDRDQDHPQPAGHREDWGQ